MTIQASKIIALVALTCATHDHPFDKIPHTNHKSDVPFSVLVAYIFYNLVFQFIVEEIITAHSTT